MRLLWIATKSPWPPVDGGRLLLAETLAALAAGGAKITLVVPRGAPEGTAATAALSGWCRPRLVEAAPRSRLTAIARSMATGRSWSVTRHDSRPIRAAVRDELATQRYGLVVAEQLQAFAQTAPAAELGLPRILRAQNVESDLWMELAQLRRGSARWLLAREAARLAREERRALRAAAATVALSSEDALRLSSLVEAGGGGEAPRIEVAPPPFPTELPGGAAPLPGEPALVLFGSAGWEPNARAARRFLAESWPTIRDGLPNARLHWFGKGGAAPAGVNFHPAPRDSREAFAPGALLVLPLDLASGVRMRILEAWARGVAVLATPAAASGLRFHPGEELLLARHRDEIVHEVRRFAGDPELGRRLTAAGRARLATDHDPARFARRFLEIASEVAKAARR